MTKEQLQAEVAKYRWYHNFDLGQGVTTPGSGFFLIWDFIKANMAKVDFTGKSVLDIGCRDGMFSLEAERRGACLVAAIDNDLSPAATEFLLPHLKSDVIMGQGSIYDLAPTDGGAGTFDITMMFGILYHLRYPFDGLRAAIGVTKKGGLILIESGMFRGHPQSIPMLYCPFKDGNPYEPGSPTFFNELGLETAMDSMGCALVSKSNLPQSTINSCKPNEVSRGFLVFKKTHEMPAYLQKYWEGTHTEHTVAHGSV